MISVIIPVYNVEKYLPECILSILNQTYTNFEIICIDDCSTDSSYEILEDFAKLDNRIKVFKNDVNSSLGFTRNRGLKIANGKYVMFLDSDDWLDFNTLEILHDFAEKNDLDTLMFKAINFDDEKMLFYKDNYYSMDFMDSHLNKVFNHNDLTSREIFGMAVSACLKLYNKSFLIKNNLEFPVGLIHEDNPFFYEMLYKANKVSMIDYYFYNRRRRLDSITTKNGKEVLDVIQIIEKCLRIGLDDENIYEKHKNTILNKVFYSLNTKYEYIEETYKEEFFTKAKDFVLKITQEFPYLENDLKNSLNTKNLNFYNLLTES